MKRKLLGYLLSTVAVLFFWQTGFSQNLLTNGNMESWTDATTIDGWTVSGEIAQESTIVHSGTYSAKQVAKDKLYQDIDVVPGKTYNISLWYYVDGGAGTDARIWSAWKDASGSPLSDNADVLKGPNNSYFTSAASWQNYKVSVTAPATAAKLHFEVRTYKPSSGSVAVYWDDFSVEVSGGADTQAPTWTTGYPKAVNVKDTYGTFQVNIDEPGKVYFIVVQKDAAAPTNAEVKAGADYGSVTVIEKDTIDISTANTPVGYNFTGAQPNTTSDVWFVAEDNAGNLQANPVKVSVTTTGARTLHLVSPKNNDTSYIGDTVVFKWTSANIDSVLIGGYISDGGPDGGYFVLTGDPDHFTPNSFKPVSAASGVFKYYLPADMGGSIKLDSVIIWDAADVNQHYTSPGDIHLKGYAAPVYLVDTLPLSITHSLPTFGMTDFMPSGWIGCDFSCDSIVPGTGNLYLKKDDGTVVQTVSAAKIERYGNSISFSPNPALVSGESYYIEIDSGFVKSYADNKVYSGLTGKKWNFTVASSSLYFSEYIEGSSNNKALEIYNPTNSDVNLDDYVIAGSHNGSGIDGDGDMYHFPKGYVLKAGSVFVLANASASQDVLKVANDTLAYNEGGFVCSFTGNDARVLMKVVNNGDDQMWVDAIGNPWEDPGDGWNVAGVTVATKDHTLLRKADVKIGNAGDWGTFAGTDADNSQWIVKDKDHFANLGKPTLSGIAITFNANMTYNQNFNPKTDSIFIAGNFPDASWNEPGTNPALRMSDADSNGIYTITLNIPSAMALEYKYFVNAGWGGGEWDGGDNRKVNIANDITLNDIFGYIDNQPPMVTVDVPYIEKFDDVTVPESVNLKGWTNVDLATGGKLTWMGKEYQSNKYVQISAYKSPSSGTDTVWLITPAINMDNSTDEKLSFDIKVGYWNNDGLKVFISSDYDQTADGIKKATWTDVTSSFTIPTEPTSGYGTFASAGTLDVSNYTGKMSVAFMYVGDATNSKTTTYQIDNVKVEGTTGIANIEFSNKISLYPNPGNGIFEIALNGTLKGAVTMRIVDITGRVVMEKRFNHVTPTINVNISQQSSNIYFVTLTDAHNTIVKKFMKR